MRGQNDEERAVDHLKTDLRKIGAGLIVIKIALNALASHYGYEVPKKPVT
jgi:hypothetical protein